MSLPRTISLEEKAEAVSASVAGLTEYLKLVAMLFEEDIVADLPGQLATVAVVEAVSGVEAMIVPG